MRNLSYENDFDLHENETACRAHFHMKGVALRLVSKQRHENSEIAYSFCFLYWKLILGEDHLTFEWGCDRFGTSTYFCNPFLLRKFVSAGCVYV